MHCHARVTALCVLCVVSMIGVAHAGPSPSLRPARLPTRWMREAEVASLLLDSTTRVNLGEVEDRIMPMLSALPQNRSGYVCQKVARYALVRYFLVYRGWNIKGLSKDGGVWNKFPTESAIKNRSPMMLLRLTIEILHKPLIGIKDLVRVVAAVEMVIYDNVKDILMMAYDTLNLSVEEPLFDPDQEQLVLKTFAMFMFQPRTQSEIAQPVEQYWKDLRNSTDSPVYWADHDLWVADTSQTAKRALTKPFSKDMDFASMTAIAEAISSGIARYQQSKCLSMKHRLMDADGTENGTVSLASFYSPRVADDFWTFTESPKYLEFIDALDLSTPHRDQVLIPNYAISSGNCAGTSSFHEVCCISECQFLLARLEAAVKRPYASPADILEVVSALASDTVRAPRKLSESLQNRLHEISRMNDAAVPLHGHIFAEWMHRAFPNECPMPASKRLRRDGFEGEDRFLSKREIGEIVMAELESNHTDNKTMDRFFENEGAGDGFQMPWPDLEEVLVYQDWHAVFATQEQKAAAAADDSSEPSTARALLRPVVAAVTATAFLVAGVARFLGFKAKGKAGLP